MNMMTATKQLQARPDESRVATTFATTGSDAELDFDPSVFREAMGCYGSGVTIVSAVVDGVPVGMTCQSFFSVSLTPPLVAISVGKRSTSFPRIREAQHFGIDVLAAGQHDVSAKFSRSGADKWAGVQWEPSWFGAPVIEGSLLHLDCGIVAVHDAGDHVLVVARVHELHFDQAREPLLFFRSEYRGLAKLADEASNA